MPVVHFKIKSFCMYKYSYIYVKIITNDYKLYAKSFLLKYTKMVYIPFIQHNYFCAKYKLTGRIPKRNLPV